MYISFHFNEYLPLSVNNLRYARINDRGEPKEKNSLTLNANINTYCSCLDRELSPVRDLKSDSFHMVDERENKITSIYMLSPVSGLSNVMARFGVCRVDECSDVESLLSC